MSKNDLLAIDANFNNWLKERAEGLTDYNPFVYYCVEQFLKPFDLSDEEIMYGITDGGGDGGIDAIYFFANRRLVREDSDLDPKSSATVNLIMIQIKESNSGFGANEVSKLYSFSDDLLDLSRNVKSLTTKYNAQLLDIMKVFKEKYLTILGSFPSVSIDYYYITKGDECNPHPNTIIEADRVKEVVRKHMSKALCEFQFINAQGLLEQVQRRPLQEKTLLWHETPMQTNEGYVGLVKLQNYYEFLQNDIGGTRRPYSRG